MESRTACSGGMGRRVCEMTEIQIGLLVLQKEIMEHKNPKAYKNSSPEGEGAGGRGQGQKLDFL